MVQQSKQDLDDLNALAARIEELPADDRPAVIEMFGNLLETIEELLGRETSSR